MARATYYKEISHEGLNEYKVIRGNDPDIVDRKAEVQMQKWEEKYQKILEKEERQEHIEEQYSEADSRNFDLNYDKERLNNFLSETTSGKKILDWNGLILSEEVSIPKPELKTIEQPTKEENPKPKYVDPKINFLERLFGLDDDKISKAKTAYEENLLEWENKNKEIEKDFINKLKEYKEKKQEIEKQNDEIMAKHNDKVTKAKENIRQNNTYINNLKKDFELKKSRSVAPHLKFIYKSLELPEAIKPVISIEYSQDDKLLIIDYFLPNKSDLPKIKEYKYIKKDDELRAIEYSQTELNRIYENLIYDIVLAFIHVAYKSDTNEMIDMVVFNGWISDVNKSTGNKMKKCLITIKTAKEEFMKINLKKVNSKDCFMYLKGISGLKIKELIPVAPIAQTKNEDKRFVEERAIMSDFNDSVNVAAIDWEDFEHLVREVFEREYVTEEAEVKVTQSSRDKGVDAIIYDHDPIKGGKIIIQAKRYTNPVNIESVRALYGVMQDEGAMKGIMVTTSDYGPDAYDFVKNKPITLLTGNHLLSMLEKYGHKVKIDLQEAKKLNADY